MSHVVYLTKEGLLKLKKELEQLTNVERPLISRQIGDAIEKGDISENAEYDAAKDAQGMLEAKIAVLQGKIANARILDESKIKTSKVQILNVVTIKNQKNGSTMSSRARGCAVSGSLNGSWSLISKLRREVFLRPNDQVQLPGPLERR